jgi:TonB-linked SusC/RagA family outer membrane protein
MRVFVLIIFLIVFQLLSINSLAQTRGISVNVNNVSIENILNIVEDQTDYLFMYSRSKINLDRKIDIHLKNVDLIYLLNTLFEGYNITYKIDGRQIVLSPDGKISNRQLVNVSGRVIDKTGSALTGVTVVIDGTTKGTITDINGSYVISNVSAQTSLVFSFMGMKKLNIPVNGRNIINVTMLEDAVGIEEVVAIGYGSVARLNLTSSISKIDRDAIKARPIPTLSEAFAGQLVGVRAQNATGVPGAELKIRIRGINTINGSSDPLFVIDGVPKADMKDINPNDIASIQILKDASSTAIYGSRGANGVVLIETQKGEGRPSFSFETFYGVQEPSKKIDVMNKDQWLAYSIWHRNTEWLRQGGSMADPMAGRPASLQIPGFWLDQSNEGTDWQDAITSKAPIQSYQLAMSSGNDLGQIYISGGYLDQGGIIYNTYYRRTNFRFNGTMNVSDRILLGLIIAPSFSDQDSRDSEGKELAIHHALNQSPLVPLKSATRDWGYPPGLGIVYPNPLEQLKQTTDNTKLSTISTSLWGQVEVLKGLKLKSQLSYDQRNRVYEFFQPGNVTYNNGNISIGYSNSASWTDWTLQNTLSYNHKYKNHSFKILLGQSCEQHKYFLINAEATGWPNEEIMTLNVAKIPIKASTSKTQNNGISFFERFSYDFKEKYLLNASIRYDGSSRFGTNNQWGLFPAVSAGWKLNEELFLKYIKWIDLLKLRVAWGKAGNDRIGIYSYLSILGKENTSWGDDIVSGFAPQNIGNRDLKWEATETTDIGLDFTGLNNRIQLNIDYYKNTTDNLLFSVPIPNTTGYSNFTTNLGTVQNQGWEVDLTGQLTTGELRWTAGINLSMGTNKVIDMGSINQFTSSLFDAQFITRVGGPVSQFYVLRTDGLLKSDDFDSDNSALVPILSGQEPGNVKYIDQNGDKIISSMDYVPYGSNIPDLIYGFSNYVQWKNFEFNMLFQGQIGGDVLFLGQRHLDYGGVDKNQFSRWIHAWKPDYEQTYGSNENPIPEIGNVDMLWDGKTPNPFGVFSNNDDLRIYNASFFRVKNITVSYRFPKRIFNRIVLKSAKIYLSMENLLTIDQYPGYTPESNSIGNETTQAGVDYATYPLARKYTLGVKITF